jgi:hypothetical protein
MEKKPIEPQLQDNGDGTWSWAIYPPKTLSAIVRGKAGSAKEAERAANAAIANLTG